MITSALIKALDSQGWGTENMSREGKEVDFSVDFRRNFLVRGNSMQKAGRTV